MSYVLKIKLRLTTACPCWMFGTDKSDEVLLGGWADDELMRSGYHSAGSLLYCCSERTYSDRRSVSPSLATDGMLLYVPILLREGGINRAGRQRASSSWLLGRRHPADCASIQHSRLKLKSINY